MMILIGQYDSPFVRRVGIAMRLYGLAYEHRPWSVFGDADRIAAYNPLIRVPTLVLDDGFVLLDSAAILDHLDRLVADPLFPREEPQRHRVVRAATLAMGLAEKAVSLFYERRLHDVTSPLWEARCQRQMGGVLAALEAQRAAAPGAFLFDRLSHADIAVACALRFAAEAHAGVIDLGPYPALAAHCARMEAMPVFAEIQQPFQAPA